MFEPENRALIVNIYILRTRNVQIRFTGERYIKTDERQEEIEYIGRFDNRFSNNDWARLG